MNLEIDCFEESSEHYYISPPTIMQDILYYPISIGYFECKPGYQIQRNYFNSYLLLVMLSGQLFFHAGQNKGIARAGQTLLINCCEPHSYGALGKCSFAFVHFTGAQVNEICTRIIRKNGNLFRIPDTPSLFETFVLWMEQMRQERRLDELQTSSALYSILMQMLKISGESSGGSVGNAVVDQAMAYIHQHLGEKLTVEMLAHHAGYSVNYFSGLFSKETGMSPYQFILKSRLELSQQLLQTTDMSVQDIAFQTGFNSVANFCKTFRKTYGFTPHSYRNRPV